MPGSCGIRYFIMPARACQPFCRYFLRPLLRAFSCGGGAGGGVSRGACCRASSCAGAGHKKVVSQTTVQKSFRRPFPKGRRFQRQSLWSRPAGREILCFHKDQEGRRNSPVGCCVVGNPIKGFPDAASHAAFGQLAICQPVFRHAEKAGGLLASGFLLHMLPDRRALTAAQPGVRPPRRGIPSN